MSRRVRHSRRGNYSEVVDTPAQNVRCDQQIKDQQPRKLIYRRLCGMENVFNGAWPKKTQIHCWYCRLPFDTVPIPIVQQYDAVRDQYDVYGITCTAACSKAYLINLRNNDSRTRLIWQAKMLMDVFGWPRDKEIPNAHPWQALAVYGGYMSVEKWRDLCPQVKIQLKKPPFVPFHIFTETAITGVTEIDQTLDDFGAAAAGDTLEEQAVQHGASFSLKDLKRPPTPDIIDTPEKLQATHPRYQEQLGEPPSMFDEFLQTQTLPSDERCQEIRDEREAERKAKRKRKRVGNVAPGAAQTSQGKTLLQSSNGQPAPRSKKAAPSRRAAKRPPPAAP